MKNLFSAILILSLFFLEASIANSTELRFGGWSKHIGTDTKYNETHNAFLVEHKNVMVGYFKNSFNSDTVALAYYKHWKVTSKFEVGFTAGAMYGYRDCFNFSKTAQSKHNTKNVCPMVYPEIRWDTNLRPGLGLLGNALVVTLGTKF